MSGQLRLQGINSDYDKAIWCGDTIDSQRHNITVSITAFGGLTTGDALPVVSRIKDRIELIVSEELT